MKGTIASLALLALELTLCLISPQWRVMNVNDSQICFKPLLHRFNTSPTYHHSLHVGPLFSSRFTKTEPVPQHFTFNHAKTETALLIIGIVLIAVSATILSSIECCRDQSLVKKYYSWFHLLNVLLLTSSLIILIVGFYSLQHILQQPLNGGAALGFFIGILFLVVMATRSGLIFSAHLNKILHVDANLV